MTGRSSSGNSCGRVSAWCSVPTMPGASMGRPSSTMPPKPSSTAPVWARSFPQACSTTFSPDRKVFICRNSPPEWNIPPGSRSIRAHPNGTDTIPATVPTTRTAPPRTWRPPSTSLPPYPAERPTTSPYRPEKERKNASTAGNNKEQKDSINQATIRMAHRPHFRSVKRTTGV